jgi:hypothetical protein
MLLVTSRDMYDLPLNIEFRPASQLPHKVVHSIPVEDENAMLW